VRSLQTAAELTALQILSRGTDRPADPEPLSQSRTRRCPGDQVLAAEYVLAVPAKRAAANQHRPNPPAVTYAYAPGYR